MAKQKTVYFCSQCGHESSKWMGQCPGCRAWNTFVEETVSTKKVSSTGSGLQNGLRRAEPVVLKDIRLSVDHILLLTIIVTVHSNLFKPYFLKIPEIIIHGLIVSYIPNHEKYFFRFRPTFVQRCTHSDVSRTQSYKKYGFRSIFQQTFCHGFHCTPCRIHIIDHKNSQACYRPCCLKRISEIFLSLFSVQFFL